MLEGSTASPLKLQNISTQTIEGAFVSTKTGDKFSEDQFVPISKV